MLDIQLVALWTGALVASFANGYMVAEPVSRIGLAALHRELTRPPPCRMWRPSLISAIALVGGLLITSLPWVLYLCVRDAGFNDERSVAFMSGSALVLTGGLLATNTLARRYL